MARPVYSRPFIRQRGLIGEGELVTVPDGYYYVVRAIAVYGNVGAGTARVFFIHGGTGQALWFASYAATDQASHYLDCHLAFANTESFKFRVEGFGISGLDVFAGGYQLLAT